MTHLNLHFHANLYVALMPYLCYVLFILHCKAVLTVVLFTFIMVARCSYGAKTILFYKFDKNHRSTEEVLLVINIELMFVT